MSRTRLPLSTRGDGGFAAVELVAGVAFLVLPVALLVLSLPEWSARQGIARLAARDAARAVSLRGWCDPEVGRAAVDAIETESGLPTGALRVVIDCEPAAPLPRDGIVTARVAVAMPMLAVPLVGSVPGWTWTAGHREPVDPFGGRQ